MCGGGHTDMLHETLTLVCGLGCAKQSHCQGVSPHGPPCLQNPCLAGLKAHDQVLMSLPSSPVADGRFRSEAS